MIGTLLVGCAVYSVIDAISKMDDTHVKRGKDLLGRRYKTVDGVCYRCDGTGEVHGKTCRKCGGSGRFHNRTWYS